MGHYCDDPAYPFLDYDRDKRQCHCGRHPCWDDDGLVHTCSDPAKPYLIYAYDADKTLSCTCTNRAEYVLTQSKYIHGDLCAGHSCPEMLTLDWNNEEDRCYCKTHPCFVDQGGQVRHDCTDPEFPLLKYRRRRQKMAPLEQSATV